MIDRKMRASLILGVLLTVPALAQSRPNDDQRQGILKAILTTDRPASVERQRQVCMNGQEPASVREARAGGMNFTPDASDSCIAALQRMAKDNSLIEPYGKLAAQLGGDPANSKTLPKAMGNAVLSGDGNVAIGNGKAATVTPPMAFDAGFTVAYTDGAANKPMDPEKLKAAAESCLDGKANAATCFSVGYVLGAQAFNAK